MSKPDTAAPPPNAVRLGFVGQPVEAVAGTSLGTVAVVLLDSLGDTVRTGSAPVTVALSGGPAQAHLRGTTTAASANGVATFSDLSVDSAAGGYTLAASADGLAGASSNPFSVDVGPAAALAFVAQPTNTVAMSRIAPAVRVAVVDSLGNAVPGRTGITVNLNVGASHGSPVLLGDESRSTSGGVATFDDLRVTDTGSGFSLTARADGLPALISSRFDVLEPNDVIAVMVLAQPGTTAAGTPFSVRVAAVNSLGNVVTTANTSVSVALVPGSGTPGALLSGTTTMSTTSGQATFTDLRIDSAGVGYRLVAAGPALTADTTVAFAVTAGNTARLAFVTQVASAPAGVAVTPAPRVAILDAQGNVVPTASNTIAVYITAGTGTPGAALTGAVSVAATGGIATFDNVAVTLQGSNYTLTAAAPGLASDVSQPFNVIAPPPPTVATIVVSPANPVLAAFGATRTFTAQAFDNTGKPVSGVAYTWASSNAAVATIDATGIATAVADGATTITATSGTVSGSTTLTVQQAVAVVTIIPNDTTLAVGDSAQVTATASDALGHPMGRPVSYAWHTDKPQKVTVTADPADSTRAWVKRIDQDNPPAHITAVAEGRTGILTVH